MLIVTPKNMIRTHFEWESKGYPHIPFPVGYISKCLFTLYLTLFLVSFLMYQIFIIISIASLLFFAFFTWRSCFSKSTSVIVKFNVSEIRSPHPY